MRSSEATMSFTLVLGNKKFDAASVSAPGYEEGEVDD